MRISDWSSDVCSSDLHHPGFAERLHDRLDQPALGTLQHHVAAGDADRHRVGPGLDAVGDHPVHRPGQHVARSEEHTSELQSLMRTSYAVCCLKKKKTVRKTPYQPCNAYVQNNISQ